MPEKLRDRGEPSPFGGAGDERTLPKGVRAMQCPHCQAENADGRVYCWRCFAPFKGGTGEATSISSPFPPREVITVRKGAPVGFIIGILALLAAVGLGATAFFITTHQNRPEKIARAFVEAIIKGEVSTLERLVIPEHREKIRRAMERLARIGQVQSGAKEVKTSVASVSRKGNEAVVKVAIEAKGGLPIGVKLELPIVVIRRQLVFWRVDLEKTDREMKKWAKEFLPRILGQTFKGRKQ